MDLATILGLLFAFGCILLGNFLEGGHMSAVVQPTAALIVFGGTLGATMIGFPLPVFLGALKDVSKLFFGDSSNARAILDEIVRYAQKARKDGIMALEKEVQACPDPFLKRAILMAVDGIDSKTIQETLELELSQMDEHGEHSAKVFEAAGGYAPTIGILGAVLGLIHVMSNLADVAKVGEGIAVAFVATIYGVGAANIIFLPSAGKLKLKHKQAMALKEMMMQGALAIQEGQNPKIIEDKLSAYVHDARHAAPPAGDKPAGEKAA